MAQTGMSEAQAAAALGFKASAKAVEEVVTAHGHVTGSSVKVRESLVLMREAMRGDTTRMFGSATILAQAFGLITAESVGMAAGIGAAAAPFALLAVAFVKGQEEAARLNNILAVTNGYAGITASSFEDMAQRMAKASDTGIGKTKANIEAMIASGKFTGDTIEQLVAYSQKMAELTGQDSAKIVASFDGMKGSLVQFAVKHEETYHDLSLREIDEIARLEKLGKHHEAELQFATDINKKVQEQQTQWGTLQHILHDVENAASGVWDALLGIGRPDTIQQKLDKAVAQLNAMSTNMQQAGGKYGAIPDGYNYSPAEVQAQAGVVRGLIAQRNKEASDAAAKAKQAQAEDDAIRKKYDNHGGRTPTDESAQRTAAVDSQVAQAQAAQLQALRSLTTNIEARASIESQVLAAETAVKDAAIDKQIAEVQQAASQKHISRALADELTDRLNGAKLIQDNVAALKDKLIAEQKADAIAKEAIDIANAQREAQASILQLQGGLARNAADRQKIELQLIDLATARTRAEAEGVLASNLATDAQKEIARITLANLPKQQELQKRAANEQAADDIAREILSVETGRRQALIDLYDSQRGLTDSTSDQRELALRILTLQQQIERLKLEEVVQSQTASDAEKKIAQAQSNILGAAQKNQRQALYGTAYSNFEAASQALGDVASALDAHNWAKATHDLIDAFTNAASILNSTSASFAQKAGAIAGLANGIGNMIGGQAGSAISGAGSGAMIGMQLGSIVPGIGNVVGGILGAIGGGISGLFGGGVSAAQRRANEDQAAAQQASTLQSAEQARYSQQQQQELTLAGLTGDALRETNIQRQQELAGLDASNRARQEEIYALQDQADKAGAALTSAAADMTNIYNAARQASQGLGAFYATLTTGPVAMNSPLRQYALTKSSLVDINTRIAAGDQSAYGEVQNAVSAFLQAAQTLAPNRQAYARDLAFAQQMVQAAKGQADSQTSLAQQQLDAAHAQVASIQTVNTSVLTVAQAVENLQSALTGQASVQSQASALLGDAGSSTTGLTHFNSPDYAYFVRQNPDLLAQFQAQTGYARGRDISSYGQIMYVTFGADGRQFTPYGQAFADGGSMIFGGLPGVDQNQLSLNGQPIAKVSAGEMMTVTPARKIGQGGGDNSALIAEVRALRAAVEQLASPLGRIDQSTGKTSNALTRMSRDGLAMQTQLREPAA